MPLPPKFITSCRPKEYLQQGISHCSAYSVKGILSAYDRDKKQHPREYHTNWLSYFTGIYFDIQQWTRVLCSYGLKAEVKFASGMTDEQRLLLLKSLLAKDAPVMIHIGNGYSPSGHYNPLQAIFVGHWITLWGYEDSQQMFYIYDSFVSPQHYNTDIPTGNVKRTYQQVLRDFGKGFPWSRHYAYITVAQ